jgi:hypothetical protein
MKTFAHPGIRPVRVYTAPIERPFPLVTGFLIAIGVSMLLWAMIIALFLAL